MKKVLIIQISTLLGFWILFISLQNENIYTKTFGIVANNWQNIDGVIQHVPIPFQKLTNDNYIQWDAKLYSLIKTYGYDMEKSGGDYIFAFFPLFPVIWKLSSLPPIGILFLNFLLLSFSIIILLRIFSTKKLYFRYAIIALSFPSIVIFLIPYSEATFFLMITIGIYGLVHRKYWIYFIGLLLASMTRPSYTFLVLAILILELFFLIIHKGWKVFLKNTFFRILPLLIGTSLVSLIQLFYGSGRLFKFIEVQKYWQNILSIPHNLRDWSHEGFAINLGVIFLIFVPLIVVIIYFLRQRFVKRRLNDFPEYDNLKHYTIVLSMLYIIGNTLFVIFFRGGSLHCLFRFAMCNPFFYILLFTTFEYLKDFSLKFRLYSICLLSIMSILILGIAGYSRHWNFSDFGIFVFIGILSIWLFQDMSGKKIYKIGLFIVYVFNLIWTAYLFNMYISNGWIFA